MNTMPKPGDKAAALTGLVVAAAVIFVVLFSVVKMTNAKYAKEGGHEAAAEATR